MEIITIPILIWVLWPLVALAQTPPDFPEAAGWEDGAVELTNPLPTDDVPVLAGMMIRAVLGVVGSIALVVFTYGGFVTMTAGGNGERARKGKEVLVWAAVGLIVIFSSYALVRFVLGSVLGLQ